ncbi:MAG: T9SS type A sorting domain-containing protein [Weeksellaceae bacterium]|nr:T9SS type A sorting domain-containing protein [Bacteroidota bacterium]MCG2780552.1 T9SS type A sorting domain-containing protein [Weeksellaceae bacterium]
MKKILCFLAVAGLNFASAQISINESFETTPNATKGFTVDGFSSSATPSGCTGKALSKNFWNVSSNTKNTIIYTSNSSNGGKLNITFKYKHPRLGTTAAVDGILKVEYSVDNGAYQLLDTFDLKTNEQFCQTYTKSIEQDIIPAGKNFNLKITGTYVAGDFYIVVDELVITQAAPTLAVNGVSKNQISVYPNPVQDVIQLSDSKNVVKMLITDFSGKMVKSIDTPSASTDVSGLKSGNYIANIIFADGTQQSHKIIKK